MIGSGARPALRRLVPAVAAAALVLAVASLAFARPGGGQSYSGGSSGGGGGSSGGGGGGGDAGVIVDLIVLCIHYPQIGIPLLVIAVVFFVVKARMQSARTGWQTSSAPQAWQPPRPQPIRREVAGPAGLDRIRSFDPEFSTVLFEDFAYALYAELQRARGTSANPASLAAFVAPHVLQALRSNPNVVEVKGVVVGAMRVVRVLGTNGQSPTVQVQLEIEANYTETHRNGEGRFWVKDQMVLTRAKTAKSRPPARARTLDCPNCGAPLTALRGTQCTYCNKDVGGGRFDWNVESLQTLSRELRGPNLVFEHAEERGNELPTVVSHGSSERLAAIRQRDPSFDWNAFQHRVNVVFHALQAGWSSRDWSRVRPFVTDNLFQSQWYWIDLYVQARARNVTENARILRIDFANATSDAHYDSITVRVYATSLDYTISDDGRLLGGSRSRERAYTEYWTFVRSARRRGQPKGDAVCPNCGAPLQVNQSGHCGYCNVKLTAGEFDWVLSRIEQDESYGG